MSGCLKLGFGGAAKGEPRKVFDGMPDRNVVSSEAMINGYFFR